MSRGAEADATASTSPWPPTARRASGRSRSSPHDVLADVDALAHALRRFPGDGGALGMVAVDEDFFLLVRVAGADVRVLLSDVTAADEWPSSPARSSTTSACPLPEDEDDQAPAGDLDLARRPRHARDGHGRAARRLRPLPRRDALRHRRPARLRRAVRRRWSALTDRRERRRATVGRAAMRARPRPRRARRSATGDVPDRRGGARRRRRGRSARGRNVREADARPDRRTPRWSRCARPPRPRGEWRLDGCTLVVTLEPCTMCAGAARAGPGRPGGVRRLRPKAGAVGSLWDVVRDRRLNHRPEVVGGVLADECVRAAAGVLRRATASVRGPCGRFRAGAPVR